MPKLHIREYSHIAEAPTPSGAVYSVSTNIPCVMEPGIDQPALELSGSTQSAPFAETTRYIGIVSDVKCHFVVGSNPVATTDAWFVPAGLFFWVGVQPGHKIAAIAAE